MNDKIQKAINNGSLIPLENIIAELPKSRQITIARQFRFIQMAMTIRKLRKQLKLTQVELANILNKKREFISRIESGRQNITLETLYQIAEKSGKQVVVEFK